LSFLFVRHAGEQGQIKGIDPANGELITWEPPTNLLKFRFFVKVVSLLDARSNSIFGGLASSGDSPIESLLPFLLLSNKGQASDPISILLLMKGVGGKGIDQGTLLTLLLAKGGNNTDPLLFLLASKGKLGGLSGLFDSEHQPDSGSVKGSRSKSRPHLRGQ
jgi:hypothetical protein